MMTSRSSSHPIHPLFIKRWSPRAFDPVELSDTDIRTMIEAARWAPSAYNIQPWRFIYCLRQDAEWDLYISLLDPFNAAWAKNASALVFLVSDTVFQDRDTPSAYNSFDAGAAWVQLALQATDMGYDAHAMAGILFDDVAEKLNIPDRYKVEIAIAIGQRTAPAVLPPELQEREAPSPRKALSEITFKGSFPHE